MFKVKTNERSHQLKVVLNYDFVFAFYIGISILNQETCSLFPITYTRRVLTFFFFLFLFKKINTLILKMLNNEQFNFLRISFFFFLSSAFSPIPILRSTILVI